MRCPSCHRRLVDGAPCPRDGARADATRAEAPRVPHVDGFEVGALLGGGGAGAVGRARAADGSDVALRVAHVGDAATRARFEREAAALRRIGAPHTATFVGAGVGEADAPWIAMSRIDGETLAARL